MDDETQARRPEDESRIEPGEPAETRSDEPSRRLRYTRRRLLIVGGTVAAGAVAAVAGIRAFGGSAASKVGGVIGDRFGPFPVRSVEDVPEVPPGEWVVRVDGLVEEPLSIDRAAWTALPRLDETVDFHCVEGWGVDDVRWGGVAPATLLERARVRPEAKYAAFHAFGGTYLSSLPLDLVQAGDAVLADTLDGEPLPAKHGGPLRLVIPRQLGYKSVKWVVRIELTATRRRGYWETRGYPEDAPV